MLRTMIIDDERIILDELAELLTRNKNIEVIGAFQNPLDALNEVCSLKPDCVFLDIEMTEMKGIEVAERLMSEYPEIEIIFVTAYSDYAAQAYDINAIDYLLKPLKVERLEKSIQKIIAKIGMRPSEQNSPCKIRCFGSFEVSVENQSVKWGRSKSKEFLAYMLQNEGRWVTKYRLCEALRPEDDPEQALAYLQMAIYTLRKNLKAVGCSQIEIKYSDDRYILWVKNVDWDVRKFESAYVNFKKNGSAESAETAISLYRDEYLEGEDWLWADLQREDYICKIEQLLASISRARDKEHTP